MTNKTKIWYLGYCIALLLFLLILFTDFPIQADLALGVLSSSIFAVSYTSLVHEKMLKQDKDYRISLSDERLIAIKEKTGNTANLINTAFLGIAAVFFLGMGYTIPAVILGIFLLIQPVILIVISICLEKKM